MEKIRLGLIDDQNLFRQSLSNLLAAIPHYEIVMEEENGSSCLSTLKKMSILPDIILLDMEMPGMDGMEVNTALQKYYPEIKVIILSVYAKDRLITRMIESGAAGYLVKNCGKKELCMAIDEVFTKGFYVNSDTLKAIQYKSAHKKNTLKTTVHTAIELTHRETQILEYICKEFSNAEIAEKLFISVRTVEGHRNNLLLKTGCKNTAGLALFAVKFKIFEMVF
jgi:DNA-binding NarL/FixJ family response regulator